MSNHAGPTFQTRNGQRVFGLGAKEGYGKIFAIKAVRFATGICLRDAKDTVELAMSTGREFLLDWNPRKKSDGYLYTREEFVQDMVNAGFFAKASQVPYQGFSDALAAFLIECQERGDNPRSVGMKMLNAALKRKDLNI